MRIRNDNSKERGEKEASRSLQFLVISSCQFSYRNFILYGISISENKGYNNEISFYWTSFSF